MIVYEFYLRDEFKGQAIDTIVETFFGIGEAVSRKVDEADGSAVYSLSRNPRTHWVQLLVDDNTPKSLLTAIEARINGVSDGSFARYEDPDDHVAPMERPREVTLNA